MGRAKPRLYEILGVEHDASTRDIVKAYRIAALRTHPDKLALLSDEEKEKANESFIQLNHAYEILKDEDRRKKYDDFGWEGEETDAFAAAYEFYKGPISKEDIEDFSKTYKGSKAEKEDLIDFYNRFGGNLTDILMYIPLSEVQDVDRFVEFFAKKIEEETLKSTSKFKKTSEAGKLKEIKQKYAKKMKKEAKRGKSSSVDENLIAKIMENRKKREGQFSDLISNMEKKYANKVSQVKRHFIRFQKLKK